MSDQVLDVVELMASLGTKRRVFHSEADFQFSFAWEARELNPAIEIRLETHPEPNVRLDVQLSNPASGQHVAVELKYMTRLWRGTDSGELFTLKNHGAQDLRAYDVVKDIERVERFTAGREGWSGFVVVLTNESSYWRPPVHGRRTNADAFRINEGVVLQGSRAWVRTGGTSRGREAPLGLRGNYPISWSDYSRLDSSKAGSFRQLVVPIGEAK